MNEQRRTDEPDEIELLLPWRASGRLSPEDAERIDDAMARNPRLQASYATIVDDMAATAAINADAPAPGIRTRERLNRLVDSHEATRPSAMFDKIMNRIRHALSPKGLALAGVAAVALIFVQAAALTELLLRPTGEAYRTASAPSVAAGRTVLVQFKSTATIADIGARLQKIGFSLADGPKPGGLWLVRIGPADMPQADVEAATERLRAQSDLISLVLPGARP